MSNEDLEMLADAAARFAASDPDRVRTCRGTETGYRRDAWNTIAQQGWLSMLVPKGRGGLGVGIVAACVVARKFGRSALPEPFMAVGVMAARCLAEAKQLPIWDARLAALMAGELVVTLAWQAPSGDFDRESSDVEAVQDANNQLRLNGGCRLVAVPSGDAFIVSARLDGRAALYWVERDQPGLCITREPCADGSAFAALRFEGVKVSKEACLAGGEHARAVLRDALDCALVVSAAELLGLMDATLDMTLTYLRTRRQFGVAIGSFQAVQHRVVDMWIQRQLTEAALEAAARLMDALDTTADARSAAASGIKTRASQAASHLTKEALQFHGAIGFADEYGLGIYLNRALVLSALLGNAAQHRRRFADLTPFDVCHLSETGER
jgi:alkylation response protein AidB-like acyl-CoA dehydrogenase